MSDPPKVQCARNGNNRLACQVLGYAPIDVVFLPGFIGNLDLMTWTYPDPAGSCS